MRLIYLKAIRVPQLRVALRKIRNYFLASCGRSDAFVDMFKVAKSTQCDLFVDIGCHHGQTILRLMETGLNAPVLAIDPSAANLKIAQNLLAKHSAITYCEAAISDVDGEACFFVNHNEQTSSLLFNAPGNLASFGADTKLEETVKVQTLTLDGLVSRLFPSAQRILIKSDTQGAEAQVVRGGITTIRNKCVAFYAEFMLGQMYENQASFEELRRLLEDTCGMSLRDIYPCLHDKHGVAVQADALWVKPVALQCFANR